MQRPEDNPADKVDKAEVASVDTVAVADVDNAAAAEVHDSYHILADKAEAAYMPAGFDSSEAVEFPDHFDYNHCSF